MSYISVETNSILGHQTKVMFVDEEGKEIDISSAIQGLDMNISVRVAETNKVTLHGLIAGGVLRAEVEDVILNVIPKAKIPQVIERLKKQLHEIQPNPQT